MSTIDALVWAGLDDQDIIGIFEVEAIGEKYREKGQHRERWLRPQLEKARLHVTDRATTRATPTKTTPATRTGETAGKPTKARPALILPGNGGRINDASEQAGKLLKNRFYTRHSIVVEVD